MRGAVAGYGTLARVGADETRRFAGGVVRSNLLSNGSRCCAVVGDVEWLWARYVKVIVRVVSAEGNLSVGTRVMVLVAVQWSVVRQRAWACSAPGDARAMPPDARFPTPMGGGKRGGAFFGI